MRTASWKKSDGEQLARVTGVHQSHHHDRLFCIGHNFQGDRSKPTKAAAFRYFLRDSSPGSISNTDGQSPRGEGSGSCWILGKNPIAAAPRPASRARRALSHIRVVGEDRSSPVRTCAFRQLKHLAFDRRSISTFLPDLAKGGRSLSRVASSTIHGEDIRASCVRVWGNNRCGEMSAASRRWRRSGSPNPRRYAARRLMLRPMSG